MKGIALQFLLIFILNLLLWSSLQAADVTISIFYPSMKRGDMYLRGSGCGLNWNKGIKASTTATANEWKLVTFCSDDDVKIGSLEVKALIDDSVWQIGSNHHIYLATNATNTFSIKDSMFPWFYSVKGSTSTIIRNVFSPELKNYRDIILYFPPSYYENTLKRYKNVLIMHDGQNLFNPSTSAFGCWYAQNSLDASIVNGLSDEIVVVGVYNTPDRNNEYTYIYDPSEGFGGKGDLYLDWIENTLIPLISSSTEYRLDVSRETLGMLGSSLGGLISCYAGWTRSDVYGKVGCMSSSFWWDDDDFEKKMMPANAVPSAPHPFVYMDSGTGSKGERDCGRYTSEIYNTMIDDQFTTSEVMTFVQDGGTHDEASWGSRFNIPLAFLYPPSTA